MALASPVMQEDRSRLDAWLTRRGVAEGAARDRLLAVVLTVAAAGVISAVLVTAVALDGLVMSASRLLAVTTAAALPCLVLAARRTRPRTCLALTALGHVALVALLPDDVALRGPATLVAAYTVGVLLTGRAVVTAVTGALALEAVGAVAVGLARDAVGTALLALLGSVVAYAAAALAGTYVGTRRRYVTLLRERAAEAEAAQEARVRTAVEGERTRMARELHDIAAHHLSGMVVQAAAVQRLVDRDPAAAREGVASIRSQGRRTLEDLRLLVGVLRDPDAAESGAPVPGLDGVAALVADARSVGASVSLTVTGQPRVLGPLADVTCYRLVQEALSNARQHAPGAAVRVAVEHGEGEVTVTVDDDGPGTAVGSGGVGLVGMRERAQLVGATLTTGPRPGGGWRVRAVVPHREEEQ